MKRNCLTGAGSDIDLAIANILLAQLSRSLGNIAQFETHPKNTAMTSGPSRHDKQNLPARSAVRSESSEDMGGGSGSQHESRADLLSFPTTLKKIEKMRRFSITDVVAAVPVPSQ